MTVDPDPLPKIPLPEVVQAPFLRDLEPDDDTSAQPYTIGPF